MCLRVRAGLTAGRVEPEGHLLEATWLPLAYSKTVPKGYFFLIVFFFPILVTKFIHVQQSLEDSLMKN